MEVGGEGLEFARFEGEFGVVEGLMARGITVGGGEAGERTGGTGSLDGEEEGLSWVRCSHHG